jgi:hypothetical protein
VESTSYGIPGAGIKHMAPGWGIRFVLFGVLLYGSSINFLVILKSIEMKTIWKAVVVTRSKFYIKVSSARIDGAPVGIRTKRLTNTALESRISLE